MNFIIKLLILIWVTNFISCSTLNNNITNNHRKTADEVDLLFERNGNVFYLNSTYSTVSTIWTYNKNKIQIYKLTNGRLMSQKENASMDANVILSNAQDEVSELDTCMELDGDSFGYRIKRGVEIDNQDWPIDIECFSKGSYQSEFLNKVVEDIIAYRMWEANIK